MASGRRDFSADVGAGSDPSLRLCVATRRERPCDELIRFVVGPDGRLVPDLARKLPGRGVWVSAEREAVAAAVRARAFAKSLKRAVDVAPDLALAVEQLMQRRLADALSLANKAGLLICGFEKVNVAIERGEAVALIAASDAAADGRGKLERKFQAVAAAAGRPAPVLEQLTIDQISLAIGRPNVVHAALTKGGAADAVLREAERLARYRSSSAASERAEAPATRD